MRHSWTVLEMKLILRVGGLWLALVVASLASEGGRPSDQRPAPSSVSSAKKFCDPVCSLRSQDAAFSLLMETFRQHQSCHIEIDYQFRLQGIAEIKGDPTANVIESNSKGLQMLRQFVYGLAKRERELRMVKLETQVANLQAAYSCVRKIDEDYVGEKVPKNLDQRTAQETLKDLVIIVPGTLAKGDAVHARTVPASVVLLNPPPPAL